MNGSSKRKLPGGKSFTVLCETKKFRKRFSKVLNGVYEEHDFDKLPLDVLISLTSPNSPGSLASDKPAGSSPSAGPSIPNNHLVAAVHTGETVSIVQTSSSSQHGSSLDQSSNRSVAAAKEGKTTSAQDDSQSAGDASVKPSDKATTSMRRQISSPSKSSLEKRTKIGSVYQRQEIIDISSGDEDNVKLDLDDSQSSSNATQFRS
ncbi:hypothetical protein VE02_05095 [Pseudogymnoascus sp. 03VT05]|nr:hypothetical protein VE02_05095 [Pseudogymnoascus sp. 03VT05]